VTIVGTLEAVEVEDGKFTAAVQTDPFNGRIILEVPSALISVVQSNLCRRVVVHGRCRPDRGARRLVLARLEGCELPSRRAADS
jgi:hypothetical protein